MPNKVIISSHPEGASPINSGQGKWFKSHKVLTLILSLIVLLLVGMGVWREFIYKPYTPPPPNTKLTYAELLAQVNNLEYKHDYSDVITLLNSPAVTNNTTNDPANDPNGIPKQSLLQLKASVYADMRNYLMAISVDQQLANQFGMTPSLAESMAQLELKAHNKSAAISYYNQALSLLSKYPKSLPGVQAQETYVQKQINSLK